VIGLLLQRDPESVPALGRGDVQPVVVQACRESRPGILVELALGKMARKGLAHEGHELLTRHVAPRRRENAAVAAELSVAITVEQRRQQFASAEVPGAAKDHQIEWFGRYELRHVRISLQSKPVILRHCMVN
jgi:hypothetical protein